MFYVWGLIAAAQKLRKAVTLLLAAVVVHFHLRDKTGELVIGCVHILLDFRELLGQPQLHGIYI